MRWGKGGLASPRTFAPPKWLPLRPCSTSAVPFVPPFSLPLLPQSQARMKESQLWSSQLHERGQRIRLSLSCKLLCWRDFGKHANMRSLELSHTDTNRLMRVARECSEESETDE